MVAGAPHVVEQRNVPVLVSDTVALEHDTAFKLSARVVRGQLGVLLNSDTEDVAEMDFLSGGTSFSSHVVPLTNL